MARVRSTASSTFSSGCRPNFVDAGARRTASCDPTLAAKGIRHEVLLRPNTRVDLFQHGGSGGRRLHAGEDRAAPRDRHGLRRRANSSACSSRAARVPATSPIPPDIAGYDPEAQDATRSSTIPRRRARCSTGSATRIATATAIARCPTASRSSSSAGRRRRSIARQEDEQWKKNMDAIGLKIVFRKDKTAGAAQDGAAGQDSDAHRRLERRLSGRREFHAAPVRTERRAGEPRAIPACPKFDKLYDAARRAARFTGTHAALRPDDGAGPRVRAVAADGAPDRGPAAAAVGRDLQVRTRSWGRSGSTSTWTRRRVRSKRRRAGVLLER